MKIGETGRVSGLRHAETTPVLNGPGWSVILRGQFYFLRALPILTGSGISEVKLSQDQISALRDGDITAEELLLGTTAQAREDRLDISVAGQTSARSDAPSQSASGRRQRTSTSAGGRSGPSEFDHRLTVAALIFSAAILLFIFFRG